MSQTHLVEVQTASESSQSSSRSTEVDAREIKLSNYQNSCKFLNEANLVNLIRLIESYQSNFQVNKFAMEERSPS